MFSENNALYLNIFMQIQINTSQISINALQIENDKIKVQIHSDTYNENKDMNNKFSMNLYTYV